MRQNLRPPVVCTVRFRWLSRMRALLACTAIGFGTACLIVTAALPALARPARAEDDAGRRAAAHAQFVRAEQLRTELESKPERARSLQDYKDAVAAFRRVYLLTARAPEVPAAIDTVGALYEKMGALFGHSYFDSAIEAYQYLVREYPASRYREKALLAIARVQLTGLGKSNLAEKSYEDFLKQYAESAEAAEARKALGEIRATERASGRGTDGRSDRATDRAPDQLEARSKNTSKSLSKPVSKPVTAQAEAPGAAGHKISELGHIRVWNADAYTRIVIDLGDSTRSAAKDQAPYQGKVQEKDEVNDQDGSAPKYQVVRVSDPDRIYFDIENARLSSELLHQPVEVPRNGYLKTVRVAQNRADVVRVVLELTKVKDYSVFQLSNPDRLVVDIYGPNAQIAGKTTARAAGKDADAEKRNSVPNSLSGATSATTTSAGLRETRAGQKASAASADEKSADSKSGDDESGPSESVTGNVATGHTALPRGAGARTSAATAAEGSATGSLKFARAGASTIAANTTNAMGSRRETAAKLAPPPVPEPMHDGTHSLTRALGLKTGRIVIDAGHGGHDTGTIGPTGLMEKDVCLDIAMRVGKLVTERLPAAEIVYTRDADKFVSLEKRTGIANEAKADLFLSIHANSSEDSATRGIETYYLNFTTSPEAMDVATRENAATQNSVHDLQTLVSKIARNEKTEESHEFAADIQEYLAKRMENTTHSPLNRGVRQAPFVVLIGANMPSVLAEISFLSNPADEQWLKKSENRERVAEGLYHGIEAYLQSTNSLESNLELPPDIAAPAATQTAPAQSRAAAKSSAAQPQSANHPSAVRAAALRPAAEPADHASTATARTTPHHSVSDASATEDAEDTSATASDTPGRIVASRRPLAASGTAP